MVNLAVIGSGSSRIGWGKRATRVCETGASSLGVYSPSSTGDFGVDLSADQICQSGNIEPDQKNHGRTQGSVGRAVIIKKMQVRAESERRHHPYESTKCGTRREPLPATAMLQVGTAVIYQRTGCGDEDDSSRPLNGFPNLGHHRWQSKSCPQSADKMVTRQHHKQGDEKPN